MADERRDDYSTLTEERLKLAFQYAWSWFELHSTQRTSVFNYFLVITGILGTAYGTMLGAGLSAAAALVALFGVIVAIGFTILDVRNRQLVRLAEDVLRNIEREAFGFGDRTSSRPGILVIDQLESDQGSWTRKTLQKHRTWIRGMQLCVGLLFAGGFWFALQAPASKVKEHVDISYYSNTGSKPTVPIRSGANLREKKRQPGSMGPQGTSSKD